MTNRDHEDQIVRQAITDLLAAGYSLNLMNGGDDYELPAFTTDFETIYKEMKATDEDRLFARKANTPKGWVYFIYGNDGYDVINDYTMSLEDALKGVNALSDKLCDESEAQRGI